MKTAIFGWGEVLRKKGNSGKNVRGRSWKIRERGESHEDRMGGKIQCTHFPNQLRSSPLKLGGSRFP
jgi:hypothetical protein